MFGSATQLSQHLAVGAEGQGPLVAIGRKRVPLGTGGGTLIIAEEFIMAEVDVGAEAVDEVLVGVVVVGLLVGVVVAEGSLGLDEEDPLAGAADEDAEFGLAEESSPPSSPPFPIVSVLWISWLLPGGGWHTSCPSVTEFGGKGNLRLHVKPYSLSGDITLASATMKSLVGRLTDEKQVTTSVKLSHKQAIPCPSRHQILSQTMLASHVPYGYLGSVWVFTHKYIHAYIHT